MGTALESTATSGGGAYWNAPARLSEITNKLTVAVWADIDSLVQNGVLMSCPYRASGWSSPWTSLTFGQQGTQADKKAQLAFSTGGSFTHYIGDDNYIDAGDLLTFYSVSKDGGTVTFYRNGEEFSVVTSPSSGSEGDIDWNEKRPVNIFNRSDTSDGEGVDGRVSFLGVWKRPLSPAEHLSLYEQPYQMLQPDDMAQLFFISPPPAGVGKRRVIRIGEMLKYAPAPILAGGLGLAWVINRRNKLLRDGRN